MIACDFFTVETVSLRRIYILFFIELQTRRVRLAGCTSRPRGSWVVQQARNLVSDLADSPRPLRFLIHDRDAKFCAAFDEVFRSEGATVIKTPIQAPNANSYAERWVRTVRGECLDWLLILGSRQLERVLRTYVDHYNRERPHRALGLVAPDPPREVARHDLPARVLAAGIADEDPAAQVEIADALAIVSPAIRKLLVGGSQFDSAWGNRIFDLEYRLITGFAWTRWLARTLHRKAGILPG